MRWNQSRTGFIVLVVLCVGAFDAAARAESPEGKPDPAKKPVRYEIELQHEEKGNDSDKLSLKLTVRMDRTKQAEQWSLTVEQVVVKRTIKKKRFGFDSRKKSDVRTPEDERDSEIRWFARLAEKTLEITVTPDGQIKRVKGPIKRVLRAGDFLAEGGDLHGMMSKALFSEIVGKLFSQPGTNGSTYGLICPLGKSIAGCHLKENAVKPRDSTHKRGAEDRKKRQWKITLHSDGGSMRSGGQTLKLEGGEVGGGKGSATYTPERLISYEEKVKYEMPTPDRKREIKRKLKIQLVAR